MRFIKTFEAYVEAISKGSQIEKAKELREKEEIALENELEKEEIEEEEKDKEM